MIKKIKIYGTIFVITLFLTINIAGVQAQGNQSLSSIFQQFSLTKQGEHLSSTITDYNLDNYSKWFPGFLLFQLLKGILAFIVILLILFDIIEP